MEKIISTTFFAIIITGILFCQVPNSYNYSAVLRNPDGTPKLNETLSASGAGTRLIWYTRKAANNEYHVLRTNRSFINADVVGSTRRNFFGHTPFFPHWSKTEQKWSCEWENLSD